MTLDQIFRRRLENTPPPLFYLSLEGMGATHVLRATQKKIFADAVRRYQARVRIEQRALAAIKDVE